MTMNAQTEIKVAQKYKDRRVRAKHIGAERKKRKIAYRKRDGTIVWPN